MTEEEMQKYVESLERASELLIQKKKEELQKKEEELQKEIEKRDKEKWISEHPEYRETHEMIELAKKAEAGEATEEQREILRQWAEKSITSSLVYEDSDDDAGRDGNTSDEDLSGKERKAKEGKASESPSSSSSTILPEKVISLASIREVYSKFKAKGGEDGDSDDEELRGLEEEYFKYLDILRRQLNGGESGKDKIEKILEEFYKDCVSNDIAKTDFWDIIYQTHNEDLIMLSLLNLAARKVKDDFLEVIKIPAHSDIEIYFKAFLKIQNEGKLNQITLNESIKNQQEKLLSVMDQVVKALSISIDSQEDENSDDDTGRDGNTSDEDLSGKEGKAKEGKVSEPSSNSSSIALPEKIITLASIREVYSKFKAKGDDFDSDDEEAWNLQDKYEEHFKILKNQVKNEKLGKGKIEEILEEFYKDCASNELAETDFCFLYNTHNANLVKMSLLNLAARIDKDNFVKMLPRTADIEMHFKYFLEKQKEGQFNQIEFNESIKNQQEKVQSVINEVAKALKISIDVTPESQSSSTSSSVGSLSASTISEVTISSVLPEIAVITDSGGSSELSGDSTETGEHLPG